MAPADRLTALSHGAGCACKLGLDLLDDVLGLLPGVDVPGLLVGPGDDAAVWRAGDRTMVATVDFFTPIVDDPGTWGRIAATNAGSDVFAMGARPVVALNVVGWPADRSTAELGAVLRGAAEAAGAGGWATVGGHSIDSAEPFVGQAVVGEADGPLLRQDAGRPGDVLVLTAPLGTGVVTTATKRAEPDAVAPGGALAVPYAAAVEVMTTHNAAAADAAVAAGVVACTDVTGFGLLGHLHRLGTASGVGAHVDAAAVPSLPDVARLVADGIVPGGTRRTLATLRERGVVDAAGVPSERLVLLADAQTSGGLVLACPPDRLADLRAGLADRGVEGHEVGRLTDAPPGSLTVR